MSEEQKRKDRAQVWGPRITNAQEHYRNWSEKFKVTQLEQAYYGFQWDEQWHTQDYTPYVMNMIFSSIDVKMPSLLFQKPVYRVEPKPAKYDFDPSGAIFRAHLKEDALNTLVHGKIKFFSNEIELCILDAFFRFGVLEIGYSADFILNPDAGKPLLATDVDLARDSDGKIIKQPPVLIEHEQIYARRIPARQFRVGGTDQSNLERCSWYGYLDFIRKEDLYASAKINDGYNVKAIENMGAVTPDSPMWSDYTNVMAHNSYQEKYRDYDIVGVWKIWDTRAKEMLMLDYTCSDIIYAEPFERPKHFVLKFRPMLEGFYPLPFVFNWISPQAEVNETREAGRIHRRRFQRKYIVRKDAFDEEELDKLQNGGDGTFALSNIDPNMAHTVLANPNLGAQHDQALAISRDDFNIIAGTSAEQRGQADRSTATQSQIKERRSVIRESRDKEIVAMWLQDIGKEILMTAKDEFALPFWIKISADSPGLFAETDFSKQQYSLITSDEFGEEDFEVNIKVSSLSPIDQQEEKNNMAEFLALVSQYPQVAMSPMMIREIADRTGFRNERAIAEYVRSAQMLQMMQIMQIAQQTGQDPAQLLLTETFMRNAGAGEQNPIAQRTTAQMTPPDMESIRNQVENQTVQPTEQ